MAKTTKKSDANELLDALDTLEKEKNISKDTLLEAIENSLITACKNHFGKADNVRVVINPETCEYHVYLEKKVVEEVTDRSANRKGQLSLPEDALTFPENCSIPGWQQV